MPPIVEILIIVGLIVANGFFAAAEIAILTARRSRLEAQAGDRAARAALALAANPAYFLPTVQIGITLVGTLAATFGGARIVGYLSEVLARAPQRFIAEHSQSIALALVVLAISFLSLIFGELVPKRLALNGAERLAKAVALPMQGLSILARPVVWFMSLATEAVLFVLRAPKDTEARVSVEDIEHLIRTGTREGVLEPAEQKAATRALRLGDRTVREVMRPRVEIDALDVDTPPDEVLGAVAMAGFSRVPVYEGDLDHIVGFLYIKDLMRQLHMGWAPDVRHMVRPAVLVPKTLRLDQLLDMFRTRHTQMAIILDEYGGTEGLVTLEDVLEELVGEIRDEQQLDEEQAIVTRDATSWLVDGAVGLADLCEAIQRDDLLAAVPHDVNTLGGLVQWLLSRIPRIGDQTAWQDLSLEVVDMDGPRIDRVLVTRPAPPPPTPP